MTARFHAHPYCNASHRKLTIKSLGFFSMLQSPFLDLSAFHIYIRYLLKLGVEIYSYNDHVRLLSPESWLVSTTKAYSGVGADIVMESISRNIKRRPLLR